jgi:hypothetical protein
MNTETTIKCVTLIESLNTREVRVGDLQGSGEYVEIDDRLQRHMPLSSNQMGDSEVQVHHLPIIATHRCFPTGGFTDNRKPRTEIYSTYVVYSPEVEKLIGVPFRALHEERANLKHDLQKVREELFIHQRKIHRFQTLPWYKRLWVSLDRFDSL